MSNPIGLTHPISDVFPGKHRKGGSPSPIHARRRPMPAVAWEVAPGQPCPWGEQEKQASVGDWGAAATAVLHRSFAGREAAHHPVGFYTTWGWKGFFK